MSPQKRKVILKFLFLIVIFYSSVLFSEPQFNITVASAIIKTSGEQEEIRNNYSVLQVERVDRYSKCASKLILLNCDYLETTLFSRSNVIKIGSRYEPGPVCNIKATSSDWVLISENGILRSLEDFHYMDTFLIEPYSLQSGLYQIILYLKEYYKDGTEDVLSEQCFFEIGAEESVPIIAGSSRIPMNNWENFALNSKLLNGPNFLHGQDEIGTIPTESGDGYIDDDSTAPMEYFLDDNFELPETDWQSSQFIRLGRQSAGDRFPRYGGFCSRNCQPISDVTHEIVYHVKCRKNCHVSVPSKPKFRWNIDAPGFDFDRDTKFGQLNEFLYIKPNVLKPDKLYNFTVSKVGGGPVGHGTIRTHGSPKLTSCQILPKTGYTFRTQFRVTCIFNPGKYDFELYSVTDDSEFMLTSGKNLNNLEFMLNENCLLVTVKIIDKYHFSNSQNLSVTVLPVPVTGLSPVDMSKDIEDRYFNPNANNSIPNLLKEGNIDVLMQVVNVLTEELLTTPLNNKTEGPIKKFHKMIFDIMKNLVLNTKQKAQQMLSITMTIAETYAQKSDPDMSELIMGICENSSRNYLGYLQQQKYPNRMSKDIPKAIELLVGCSKAITGPNFEILKPEDNVEVPTTPYPLIEFPLIAEDYPDYVDDQNLSKILTKYESSTSKLINQCYQNAKTLALSLSIDDDTKSVGTYQFQVTVTKKLGLDIPHVRISSQDVNLSASADFIKYADKEVNVLLCTITKNPFWWIGGEDVGTTVAMLAFNIDGKVISSFVEPFRISFKNNENNFSSIIVHTATTPRQTVIENQEISDFERIAMFRIDVFRKQGYVIEFLDLASSENFNVYVTDFVKPTPEEFRKKSVKINQNNSKLVIPYEHDYDGWHYLSVLPDETMGDVTPIFKFRVYTLACYRWQPTIKNWELACGVAATSTLERFDCLCHQSSVLSGRLIKNNVREEISTSVIIEQLEFQSNSVIFISVGAAFFLYCVLLIYITMSPKKNIGKSIYFLSDNPSWFLFGYILIVKTGHESNAGTTSNVVIKLYGKNAESKEHVLNFPDPEKRILQKNQEDCFFLATENYLGEITKLDLWFDSLGFRPSWYCSEIEVIDLQMNAYWWFNIKYRFEICEEENHFITAVPENRKEREYKKRFALKKFSMHGCHMWNIFREEEIDFSKTKRLTIMLSIFMTTCTVILFLYGCPKLQDSDSLGPYTEYSFHVELVWTTICGFTITFLVHFPFVYYFRYYHENKNEVEKKKLLGKFTPHQIDLICWCLLVFLIIATMTTLVVFGFWVQDITALLWLTSTGISLLIYILLLENCLKFVYNLIMRRKNRVHYILSRIKPALAYIDAQRIYIYKSFGQIALRPYFKHLYKPLSPLRIKEQKHWARIKQNTLEILEDLVMITIYVVLLYTLIVTDKDPMTYISNQEVRDLVIGIHSRTKPATHPISTRKEIQEYITETAIFSMQSPIWYGKFVSKDPGMTIDNNNKYIGIARLRQLRSHNKSCTVVSPMKFLRKECVHGFSDGPEYGDFSEGWGNDNMSEPSARMDSLWNYKGFAKTGSFSYVGKFATYPGGGYVANLGRTLKNSLINADYIFRNNWIDKFTRCLFMEVLLYNSNSNLFQSVMVIFEISTSGIVRSLFQVDSARLLFAEKQVGLLLLIVMASFVLMVLLLILKLLYKIVRKKNMVFRDIWHIVDIIIITISLACTFLYMGRSQLVKIFLTNIEHAKHNEFVNYTQLFFAEAIFTSLAALLVFLATLRLWKLMKFLLIIKITEKTLALSVAPLTYAMIQHVLTIFLFTLVGLIFFADHSSDFKDILDSVITLVILSLGLHRSFDIEALKIRLRYFYYTLYMIISLYYLTVYIAIITLSYGEAQLYYSNEGSYGVFDYLKEQYQYYRGVAKVKLNYFSRLRGGQDTTSEEKPVFPKADHYRYANCLALPRNRMNAMLYATRGMLRSMKKKRRVLTKDGENMMKMIIVNFFRNDSKKHDYFFINDIHSRKSKLVDDLVLQKMEKVVTILLTKPSKRREKLYEGLLEDNYNDIERMSNNLSVVLKSLGKIEIRVPE